MLFGTSQIQMKEFKRIYQNPPYQWYLNLSHKLFFSWILPSRVPPPHEAVVNLLTNNRPTWILRHGNWSRGIQGNHGNSKKKSLGKEMHPTNGLYNPYKLPYLWVNDLEILILWSQSHGGGWFKWFSCSKGMIFWFHVHFPGCTF